MLLLFLLGVLAPQWLFTGVFVEPMLKEISLSTNTLCLSDVSIFRAERTYVGLNGFTGVVDVVAAPKGRGAGCKDTLATGRAGAAAFATCSWEDRRCTFRVDRDEDDLS